VPLRQFGVRFTGVTKPGQVITVSGKVIEKLEFAGEPRLRCEVVAVDQEGHQKLQGTFVAALSKKQSQES
jgi:acyl dehydratase